jgi:hypothetical protein
MSGAIPAQAFAVRSTGRVSHWLPALFVVSLTLALRLHGLEQVRHNYDRAYPHGLAFLIRDALQGDWAGLPRVSLVASINFPNPAGASYFYALLTAIEPSAYVATALNAMLGAAVAAIAFNLAWRTFGLWAATAAGVFVGSGVWAGWVSRGAWLQGPIEFMAALTLWLMVNGLVARRPRHLLAAFAWVALCMQTYLVAFGLLTQAMGALIVASVSRPRRSLRPVRSAAVAGLAMCALSLLIYIGAVASERASLEAVVNNPNALNEETRAGGLNLDPINHALRIASGRDFENTFVEADTPDFALRDQVSDLRATVVDVLMALGLGMMAAAAFGVFALTPTPLPLGEGNARIMLAWVALPIIGTFLIANLVMRDWKVHVFYLLLASPVPYILAGAPFSLVERIARRATRHTRYALRTALLACAMVAVVVPWWNADGDVQAAARFPLTHDGLYSLPLKQQMRLAQVWRAFGCTTLDNEESEPWLASLIGDWRAVIKGRFFDKGQGYMWETNPDASGCLALTQPLPSSLYADAQVVPLPGQKRTDRTPAEITLYRAPAITQTQPVLTTNIGWSLLDLHTPATAKPGETVHVAHRWRVDGPMSLDEDYGQWYFAPFVKLVAPDGQVSAQIDSAPSVPGYLQVPGMLLLSDVPLTLAADLPAGDYTLEMSLFDPNQKKNAVYFDPVAPSEPIVTIRRTLVIGN